MSFLHYAADGEPLSTHTAAEVQAIAQKMGEWINVNLAYNEQLRAWTFQCMQG